MPSLTKIKGEMKSMFDKASDGLNLMITNKINSLEFDRDFNRLKNSNRKCRKNK